MKRKIELKHLAIQKNETKLYTCLSSKHFMRLHSTNNQIATLSKCLAQKTAYLLISFCVFLFHNGIIFPNSIMFNKFYSFKKAKTICR